jgi:hypothetical protein
MNNNRPQFMRILALDLHPASFGYAVLENAELLDWGTRRCTSDGSRMPLGISRLMDVWDPTQIVVREGAPARQVASIKKRALKSGVKVVTIRRSLERKVFESSCANRFDRAVAIASRYAPLQARVPERRKLGYREPYQIRLFNAIATGLAHMQDKPGIAASLPRTRRTPINTGFPEAVDFITA